MKIRTRLILILTLSTLFIVSGFVYFFLSAQSTEGYAKFGQKIESYSNLLPKLYEIPMWNVDQDSVVSISSAFADDPEIESLVVFDSYGKQLFARNHHRPGRYTKLEEPIEHLGNNLGTITVLFNDHLITESLSNSIVRFFLMTVVLMLGLIVVVFVSAYSVTRALDRVIEAVGAIATGNYIKIPFTTKGELQVLIASINSMADELEKREAMIKNVTTESLSNEMKYQLEKQKFELERLQREQSEGLRKELEDSLANLREAQNQLVISEKMAVLGGLVAGIAHEINTPLGIGVTAASYLQENLNGFIAEVNHGVLKKSHVETYLKDLREATELVSLNLRRAAELIHSFKQVSVDQTNENIRVFDVGTYVQEVIQSLHPKLKKTNHDVRVDCPKSLAISSFPGAFSQILTNLIINSLVHGLKDDEGGVISIRIALHDETTLVLEYSDSGKGLTAEQLKHIFEPFYTSMRNSGGTGLGTYIVYNLATQRLQGTVSAESAPGKGLKYTFRIPVAVVTPDSQP